MTLMRYMKPQRLYQKMVGLNKNAIVLDVGDKVTGLSVAKVTERATRPIPWVASCKSNFPLTAVESVIKEFSNDTKDHYFHSRVVLSEYPYVPQVLKLENMTGFDVREVLNATARLNNVGCIIFGLSADTRKPFDPNNYTFITEFMDMLEEDGGLTTRCFCLANEFGSTKAVDRIVKDRYPMLTDLDRFVEMYPSIHDFQCCVDRADLWSEIVQFRKGLTDCYAASHFSSVFVNRCEAGKLDSKKVRRIIKKYINFLGYKE